MAKKKDGGRSGIREKTAKAARLNKEKLEEQQKRMRFTGFRGFLPKTSPVPNG